MSVDLLHERFLDESAPYWRENVDMRAILYAYADESYRARNKAVDVLFNEFFTDTASHWGLRLKEELYGIYDGIDRTLIERRGRVRARERGGRVATIGDLEFVAAGFVGGTVEITPDYDNFVMTVEFVDILGIPTRISDVQAALDKALPAYYTIVYTYRYNTYNDVKTAYATYDQLLASGLVYSQVLTTEGD